jgi:hypothetical protein
MTLLHHFAAKKENHDNDSFYSWQVKNGDGYLITIDRKAWLSGEKTVTPQFRFSDTQE